MEESRLPTDLERIERFLSRGPKPMPSPALRQRVLAGFHAAMRKEILDESRSELQHEQKRSTWQLGAAIAASLLIGAGLTAGIIRLAVSAMPQHDANYTVGEVADRLQRISPQTSREGALRQAAWRQIGVQAGCEANLGSKILDDKSNDH